MKVRCIVCGVEGDAPDEVSEIAKRISSSLSSFGNVEISTMFAVCGDCAKLEEPCMCPACVAYRKERAH